ncbi:hypothetical protein SAMN00808754_1392 [Thermanaeromonas toyohensis ToBE]|uniref:Uncharacterized protein n=1 Tax=Thermanaeromonas toyohensis ToBE TaxID=698762 RepID=A0A1W1VRU2_9FIRM|nr:hypothetical protein [Thermanaeromonas toyohensis]SMB96056.1 hypothetical protein SAMN00808754_1392 [Thermanaeromonas toyohensis ToBE]
MMVTEYSDCLALRFTNIPEAEVDKTREDFELTLVLPGKQEITITVVAHRKKSGVLVVAELLLDKSTSEQCIREIAELEWHIFPASRRGKKLGPVVAYWEGWGHVVAACLPAKYGLGRRTFEKEARPDGFPYPRQVCWWPDPELWDELEDVGGLPEITERADGAAVIPFHTFSSWAAGGTGADLSVEERPAGYSAYLRRLRTALLWYVQKGRGVELEVVELLAPGLYSEKVPMQGVYVERKTPCVPYRPVGVVGPLWGVVNLFGHLGEMAPVVDCISLTVMAGNTPVEEIFVWMNPLAGDSATEEALRFIVGETKRMGLQNVIWPDTIFWFRVCRFCGDITTVVPDAN